MTEEKAGNTKSRILGSMATVIMTMFTLTAIVSVTGREADAKTAKAAQENVEAAAIEQISNESSTENPKQSQEVPGQFEDWVKPQIEGIIPVYSRDSIDYITDDEFNLLAKAAYAEAGVEGFEGELAVVEVVLNRVESKNYPDTIEGVIKQEGQFETWSNGSIEKAEPDDCCMEAVQTALEERTFPVTVVWFREGRYHDYGTPYCIIKHHYFSTEEENDGV